MSNLAQKLANIGMIAEAMSKCEKALKIENYHKNVADVISGSKRYLRTKKNNKQN